MASKVFSISAAVVPGMKALEDARYRSSNLSPGTSSHERRYRAPTGQPGRLGKATNNSGGDPTRCYKHAIQVNASQSG